ncbi:MAG: tetratricopeptide repeat protein [Candidatus Helarchaeota archaeon]
MSKSFDELLFRAEHLLFEKKYEKAIKIFKKILKSRPNDIGIRKSIGIAYFELGNYQNALKNFQIAAEIEDSDSELWSYIGKVYIIKNEKEKALWCFQKAIEIDKDMIDEEFQDLIGFGIEKKIKSLKNEGIIPIDPDLEPKHIVCNNCKKKILIDKNSKFCRNCGMKL